MRTASLSDDLSCCRFGPNFERQCGNPRVIECATYKCQKNNACQHTTDDRAKAEDGGV